MSASGRPSNIKQRSAQSQRNMASSNQSSGPREDEPLLGAAGDAQQREDRSLWHNLYLGTGVLAQVGIWILVGIVWGAVFTHPLIFFSFHPLFNSAGILLLTQAVIILQPTSTAEQKASGALCHAIIGNLGNFALVAGLIFIEINKGDHGHFESPHAILGLITYIFLAVQWFAGATVYFVPQMYGSVARAKSLYKYHRMSGYVMLLLFFATVCAATKTDYNVNILHIRLWTIIVTAILTFAGLIPRVRKSKLGF